MTMREQLEKRFKGKPCWLAENESLFDPAIAVAEASQPLRLLYLCPRSTYESKMSRVRFHSMQAVSRITDCLWSGPGWSNYNDRKDLQANIESLYAGQPHPDLVIAYKPAEVIGLARIGIPKCLIYNEMFDIELTTREIVNNRVDLVICHHRNDMAYYQALFQGLSGPLVHFAHIPHCADSRFYKDYDLPKRYDLLLVGARGVTSVLGPHYPLRDRMVRILGRMSAKYRCAILEHPGGELGDASTDRNTGYFAREINSARITVTCSGTPRSRFGKYVEIPMCASALAADMPGQDESEFARFLIRIESGYSDSTIINILGYYLEHEEERQRLVSEGLAFAARYTQERYAEWFVEAVRSFLRRDHTPRGCRP